MYKIGCMRVAILGAGALGCFFAAKLSQKYDVLLVGRDEGKIKVIRKNGITVTGLSRIKSNKKIFMRCHQQKISRRQIF